MIPWKLYYDDADMTFVGDWTKAPTHGVICCVVLDTTEVWGRFVNSGYAPHHVRTNAEYFVCYPDNNEPFVTWDLAPFRDRKTNEPTELAGYYESRSGGYGFSYGEVAASTGIGLPDGRLVNETLYTN